MRFRIYFIIFAGTLILSGAAPAGKAKAKKEKRGETFFQEQGDLFGGGLPAFRVVRRRPT